ncbi:5-formyltetrahydrofolate cyclo-ligase [Rickettsiales endosymbiont of Stachyamoeba lipophora]|uniref:5-formyltetrahydrofolate cyclo-ligase n=1 Tax=Rickettsiales endosymbiont of Stachyamoeba lipophora TaxID=2486578 RepID=UPI000F652EC1|nr:5-formyltetrahydrofolate cyclo-ligase [Rickettsiales endosymbiont of Stachyamoeba lipophora]AZL15622.1 5-formyltetrahydrofolate cyclo-ligase [Rickettsiales endosymbiont of Stachyamoeba lipophora]
MSSLKSQLRKEYLNLRKGILPNTYNFDSSIITHNLLTTLSLYPPSVSKNIAIYYPIFNEPNILELASLLKDNIILLPKICDAKLIFLKMNHELISSYINSTLLEPAGDITSNQAPDIIIVPGIVFNNQGYRIGYGKGYYDKTIASLPKLPLLIGVGFEMQLTELLFQEKHDIKLDYLITEKNIYNYS